MKKIPFLLGILFLSGLMGCRAGWFLSTPPWHFSSGDQSGSDSSQAPQAFIDQANQDFAVIMPAYESGTYPDKFDARFAKGPTLSNLLWGKWCSVRSSFDPHLRREELAKLYKDGTYILSPPTEDWQQGYFVSQSPLSYKGQFPPGAQWNTDPGTKLYGFIWKNDFSQAVREINASPSGISFSFTWNRTVQVPGDVSMTGSFKDKATVILFYDHNMNLASCCFFPDAWGVAPQQ